VESHPAASGSSSACQALPDCSAAGLVASSTNASSVQASPRVSNQACSEPSICTSSPRQSRRRRGWRGDSVCEALQRAVANAERKAVATDIEARRSTLTARETEVLTLLMEGHLNKVIAAQLEMSIRTAEHHRARILEKMGARSLSQLIKMLLGTRG
jgi:DNA-binding NarL/FixJ family response regulator